jgi:hypothetical protein
LKILPYSVENLAKALSNEYTSVEVISSKNHFIYLKDYLGNSGIDASSIVIEENYVSKDDNPHVQLLQFGQCYIKQS